MAKDIVRHFEEFALANDIVYTYGNIENLNLKMNVGVPDDPEEPDPTVGQIYMLAEPTTRKGIFSVNGNQTLTGFRYTGAFTLLVKSSMDMPYFTELDNDQADSKYTKNIEPLLQYYEDMAISLGCTGFTVEQFDCIDAVDFLDENRDGILIRYSLTFDR